MNQNHPLARPVLCLMSAIGTLLVPCCSAAFGQNLGAPPPARTPRVEAIPPAPPPPAPSAPVAPTPGGTPADQAPQGAPPPSSPAAAGQDVRVSNSVADALQGVSLFAVTAPPPHKYGKHDVVEVIINEASAESSTQTTDFKKDYNLQAKLAQFPSLQALFKDATLTNGIGSVQPAVGFTGNKELKGTGKIDRKDSVTAKVSAFVVDAKPNGNLVLEARMSQARDKETTTVVISGTCRAEDITKSNTIQSGQLAGFTIRIEHEGDVKESGQKGLIPRFLEAIFNF